MSEDNKGDKNLDNLGTERQPFPKTSAQVIGWKSAGSSEHTYGVREQRARRKCDLVRVLKWPYEGL